MEKLNIINFATFTIDNYSFDRETVMESINQKIIDFVETEKPSKYRIVNTDIQRDKAVTIFTVFIAYEE